MPKKKKDKRRTLDPLRRKLSSVIKEANKRVSQLMAADIPSRALEEALRSLRPKQRESMEKENRKLFDVSDLHSKREVLREASRVKQFLSDFSSTVFGSKYEFDQMKANQRYKEAFHGRNVNYEIVDKDLAKLAFKAYRKVIDTGDFANTVYFEGGYGSNNLINFIYQEVVKHSNSMFYNDELNAEAAANAAMRALESFEESKFAGARYEREHGNEEEGAFYTSDKDRLLKSKKFWERLGL